MNTTTITRLAVAVLASALIAGAVLVPSASAQAAAPEVTAVTGCPATITVSGKTFERTSSMAGTCGYYDATANFAIPACPYTIELAAGASLRIMILLPKQCGYRFVAPAPVEAPATPEAHEAPAPVTAPVPVIPAPVTTPAPAPTAPSPDKPSGSIGSAMTPLQAMYTLFAKGYPGTLAYGSGGRCVKRNFGFVTSGTLAPLFTVTSEGITAQVKITRNDARNGYDVQWYICE